MRSLFEQMLRDAGILAKPLPEGVEYHIRQGEEGNYAFYLNHGMNKVAVEQVHGKELVTGNVIDGKLELEGHQTAVILC